MNKIEQEVSQLIANILGCSNEEAYSVEDIYKRGVDSFAFMQLITDLERNYSIFFSQEELMSGSFRNVRGIAFVIMSKCESS